MTIDSVTKVWLAIEATHTTTTMAATMPKKKAFTINCSHCGAPAHRNGTTKSGTPRYRCRSDKHPAGLPRSFSLSGVKGRPKDKNPSQGALRVRRHRGVGGSEKDS